LKEETLDRTLWKTRFGRVYGPVVRQKNEWIIEVRSSRRNSKTDILWVDICGFPQSKPQGISQNATSNHDKTASFNNPSSYLVTVTLKLDTL
jgi:hypothetical protein